MAKTKQSEQQMFTKIKDKFLGIKVEEPSQTEAILQDLKELLEDKEDYRF